jgi:3-oxoacyl-[acyl-carrier protein] reductase
MELGLRGKRALVCAASKGLGLAVAEALAREGAALFLCSRDEAAIQATAARLRQATGATVQAAAADLARPEGAERLARLAEEALGGIDVLVNNVGGPTPSAAAVTDTAAWQKGFEQVFLSAVTVTRTLVPGMRARHFGRIVTITSTSVVEPIEHLVVSTAMRAAVTGFSRTLATELAADGITVNTVMPGVIHTGRIEQLRQAKAEREGSTLAAEMAKTAKSIPAGRLGRPEELADLVAFLASERASYMTGLNIAVDGGARRGF